MNGTGKRKKAIIAVQDNNFETASDDLCSFHRNSINDLLRKNSESEAENNSKLNPYDLTHTLIALVQNKMKVNKQHDEDSDESIENEFSFDYSNTIENYLISPEINEDEATIKNKANDEISEEIYYIPFIPWCSNEAIKVHNIIDAKVKVEQQHQAKLRKGSVSGITTPN
ncbi:hypothetical protein RhiirA4_462876 [Rhizophagus irregularis]|uniref:Uncharacterized protein n=1 Tax=Rhizophagus irregularis TaxID=588596 RepID=A0A2I1GLU0_9GLOM|nr:hypothetical protein RhiirA4_462876 [Rhizophagus irregularis]